VFAAEGPEPCRRTPAPGLDSEGAAAPTGGRCPIGVRGTGARRGAPLRGVRGRRGPGRRGGRCERAAVGEEEPWPAGVHLDGEVAGVDAMVMEAAAEVEVVQVGEPVG